MKKPRKIPKTVLAVVDRCRSGQTLCRYIPQHRDETGKTQPVFFYEPGGRRCGQKTAEKAIALGLLKPTGDGLFGPETSQTFVAAQ